MSDPLKIVVGVDFSSASRRALAAATAISERVGGCVEAVHVFMRTQLLGGEDSLPRLAGWADDQKRALGDRLEEWTAEAGGPAASVSGRVVEGAPSRLLPEVARSSQASLIVVGQSGSAGLRHVLLGSVAERVVHLASCPVLVVPESVEDSRPPARLLVCVDFSRASRDAYTSALGLAGRLGAQITLVHVRPGERELFLENWSELVYSGEYPYAQADLERWARTGDREPVEVEARVLEGNPDQLLLEVAKAARCDWVVLGLQGRTALASLLMGSTTHRVLKLADRPVLVVPASASPGEDTG